jgi:HD superfamily phosphohydrolase
MSESELLVRDPLYGLIRITPADLSILKTIPITRMRWIKQMGLACLVFPGANHTRFEHSIGTLFVANRLIEGLIKRTDEDFLEENIQEIRFAALLHDLGHSPFSHVTEEFFQRNPKFLPISGGSYDHERYTEEIILKDRALREIFKKEGIDSKLVSKLAIGKSGTFLDSLMSSSVDVDKIDYVSRDGYFCGLPYGRVDLSSLVESIDLAKNKLGKTVVVFDRKGRDALEGLLMSRFYLATTIHVDERNCGANMLLFGALAKAYELVLKPAMKERSGDETKRLILDCLHLRWVDHDLITFLEDPFQKLRIAAIEALREGFSSLKPDVIEDIIKLMSEQPIKRRTRYLSHALLKKVLRGRPPGLKHSISLAQFSPLTRYSLYVFNNLSRYTNYINIFCKMIQEARPYSGREIFVDITAPKSVEINTKIKADKGDVENLLDFSPMMRSLATEIADRLTFSVYSYQERLEKTPIARLEFLINELCDIVRQKTIKKDEFVDTDLILMLYHSMYREREFFEGDTRFQALFSVVFDELLQYPCRNYRELVNLPKHFGDLNRDNNYETFRNEGYPEFYSVKFAQDLEMLSEMGLLYSRSGPVQIGNTEQFEKRFERRISHYGRTYVERYLLKRYPFSNSLRKKVQKIMASNSPLIKFGL